MELLDQPMPEEGEYHFNEKIKSLLSNGFDFDLGGYISKGHQILMKELGSYIGYELLVVLIFIVLGIIPFIGAIANFVIAYSLIMGFAIFARRIYRDRPRSFRNFFDGFKLLGPLVLLRLLNAILIALIVIPYILITLGSFFLTLMRGAILGDMSAIDPTYIISNIVKLIPLFFIVMIIQMLLSFSSYIVTFGRKGAVDAMTLSIKLIGKKFLSFILFFIVLWLINIAGAILLLVGLLYTIPLSLCSLYAAYESIVGTNPNDELLDK
jgi:hypothetical protein